MIGVYAILEMLRSRLLVRAGLLFDQQIAEPYSMRFIVAISTSPAAIMSSVCATWTPCEEFLTGSGLLAFCDAPWFPVFVFASFLLHPWFGYLALAGSAITLGLTFLNEKVTRTQLNAAGNASMMASQSAQSMFRNTEVLQAMGMLAGNQKDLGKTSRNHSFPPGCGQRSGRLHYGGD